MKIFKRILILIGIILISGFWYARPLLKVGAAYSAKMACSCHYLQGRSLEDVHLRDLTFSAMPLFDLQHLKEKKGIKASLYGLISAQAYYIEGVGCVGHVDETIALPTERAAMEKSENTYTLPVYDSLPAGLNTALLQTAGDTAFRKIEGGESRGVVVLHDGHLVYEQYGKGFDADSPLYGWSMTKSITNALVGIMVKNGRLSLEQDHLFPHWDDERADITLDNLMQMNSGLKWDELYATVSDATKMLFLNADMGAYANAKPSEFKPNVHWSYSSGTTNILSLLIRQTLNDDDAYYALLQDSLFAKLGMQTALIEPDQSGTFVGSSFGWASARDWAKFGQLYLQDGIWDGERILPQGWVSYSREQANGSEGVYGAQIWLKRKKIPHAPDDIFAFTGFQDQRVYVIPSRNCVIVRLGINTGEDFDFDRLITDVLAALP